MKIVAIILILIHIHYVLSENPSCGFYDFNDPEVLSEFDDCTLLSGSRPLRILSYGDSTFPPFREDSRFFLTTNKSVHSDVTQCISTKIPFRGNFSSFSFQIGINLRNNEDVDQYNDVQLFIADILAFQINAKTNDWSLYQRDYSLPSLGSFDNAVVGLKVRIGSNSDLAVEFLKFYDRELTDENCVPLEKLSTPDQSETTTEVSIPETEAPIPETEAPIPETEAPIPETEAPIPETEAPIPETDAPIPETEAPIPETETPIPETEAPIPETEAPIPETAPPTEVPVPDTETPEAPTPTPETEISTPDTEVELPACLKIDFNSTTSLVGTLKECHLQYLPELIIKSYSEATITPFRDTSLFFLSNKWEGWSCLETISTVSLPESSFVESAIFLNGAWPGAWIEISVVDIYTGEHESVIRLEIENRWIRFSKEIKGSYSNAQFIVKTNMNGYSQLAVEYLNIRNYSC